MKTLKYAALALALGSGYGIADECAAPASPTLPDGAASTMEQMLEGQQMVKAFQAANADYMKCLEPGIESTKMAAQKAIEKGEGADEAKAAYEAAQNTYNAAVTAEEELAGQFNAEVREYKAANP